MIAAQSGRLTGEEQKGSRETSHLSTAQVKRNDGSMGQDGDGTEDKTRAEVHGIWVLTLNRF